MSTKQAWIKGTDEQNKNQSRGNTGKKKRNRVKKTTFRYDPMAKYGDWAMAGSLMLPDIN